MHRNFRWQVDEHFNIAEACCGRWARAEDDALPATKRIAIRTHRPGAETLFHTYSELQRAADALSHVLAGLGVQRGDRVAIVMPQRFETAVAYMAIFQMGAVAMPLSMLFGPDALAFRLQDSEAVVAICDESAIASVKSIRTDCPALRTVVAAGAAVGQGDVDYESALAAQQRSFTAVKTKADEAAILIYTSGTTGPPKGALLAHRALIGNLPGFVCSQNWFGFDGKTNAASDAVFWSPADWAWTGGLMDALLPTLYFGRPIVAFNGRFSPELAFSLMAEQGVTHSFLFPTALKAMMKAYPQPRRQFRLRLQGLMSAGEAVGDAVFAYCREQLGVTVNEMFGQTEVNYIVGNCSRYWPARPGSMGKAYPGHRVAVLDDEGRECAVGVPGDVAVNRFDVHGDPDPIFFLGYWRKDEATRAKFSGDWCRTGDLARRDADGYLWYEGRADDVFKAAGYRIGPGEIENCLIKHPAVVNAAVVPKPDRERGAVVKAYVVLAPDFIASRAGSTGAEGQFELQMIAELQAHVKNLLAPYEYPKEIEFIDALPMTTTGKVQRRVLRLQEEARFKAAEG
ncbi:acyl-CoA synthetase [Polaromonas jejuensis]|uniref:Acyl-CoA synthetase n=1 Tax=Polaromonas jejuensis TaxID=457502 RepID=A0ABW0Q833_9BURK|nr:AMP-binding protein [Polaromonas jejuensis]